jgi:glycosyltransferase involved in cell wall biosynthesis
VVNVAPRVAVIIPCFNSGDTLPETLAELPLEEIELVVIDDGSTDPQTLDVLRDVEAHGVRVVRTKNGGVAAALMRGFRETSAPYVLGVAADDLVDAATIRALADALDAQDGVAFAYGEVRTFGATDLRKLPAPVTCPWLITVYNQIEPPIVHRRAALEDVGGWQPGVPWDDWHIHCSMLERGHCGVHVPGAVWRYRQRPGSGEFHASTADFDERYRQLRALHPELFLRRRENWRRSPVPILLRAVLAVVDWLPGLGRLRKTQLAELLVVVFWRRDLSAARAMAVLAARRGFRATA